MKQTSDNNVSQNPDKIIEGTPMSESYFDEEYHPPAFDNQDQSIIIPQDYISKKHKLEPIAKGKTMLV